MNTMTACLQAGEAALNSGHPHEALMYLRQANRSSNGRNQVEIAHLSGICLRLLGRFYEAEAELQKAYDSAESDLNRGRIVRDQGMVDLNKGDTDKALLRFKRSLALLSDKGHSPEESKQYRVEYFVSVGFVGRAYLAKRQRYAAASYLRIADGRLAGQAPYELNNLVWLLKALPLRQRLKHFNRAWQLARAARNHRRQMEILAVTASPRLARRLAARR